MSTPSSSFAVYLSDPSGTETGCRTRRTQTGITAADKQRRKQADLEDTAESPPKLPVAMAGRNGAQKRGPTHKNKAHRNSNEGMPSTRRASKRLAGDTVEVDVDALETIQRPSKAARKTQAVATVKEVLVATTAVIASKRATRAAAQEEVATAPVKRPTNAGRNTWASNHLAPKKGVEEELKTTKTRSGKALKAVEPAEPTQIVKSKKQQREQQEGTENNEQPETVGDAVPEIQPSNASPKLSCSECEEYTEGCRHCRAQARAQARPNSDQHGKGKGKNKKAKSPKQSSHASDTSSAAPDLDSPPVAMELDKAATGSQDAEMPGATADAGAALRSPVKVTQEPMDVDNALNTASSGKRRSPRKSTAAGVETQAGEAGPSSAVAPPLASSFAAVAAPAAPAVVVPSQQQQQQQQQKSVDDATWWDPLDSSKVGQVQSALHVSSACVPGQLPLCREPQIAAVDTWLADRLQKSQGGSLYLSGLPGTGKSLTAMELVRRCGGHVTAGSAACLLPPALITVNCMRFNDPRQVVERILAGYRTACRQLDGAEGVDPLVQVPTEDSTTVRRGSSFGGNAATPQEALRSIALQPLPMGTAASASGSARRASGTGGPSSKKRRSMGGGGGSGDGRGMIVVVLDELDGMLTGKVGDALVAELFALAHAPCSRLVLIGIANSIDLVQQLMRPGGSLHRHNLRPAHEIFPAYLSSQVAQLLTQRLSALPGPVVDPKAIQLCARKVANGSGDMRLALEACSKAVSILVAEEQEKTSAAAATATAGGAAGTQTTIQEAGPSSQDAPSLPTVAFAKSKVGMRQMAAALSQVTGGVGISNINVAAIQKLPVPQQLLVATVSKLLGEKMNNRGLKVKVPTAAGIGGIFAGSTAATRFIGTAVVEQPLLNVSDDPFSKKGKKPAKKSLGDAHRRRSSMAAPGPGDLTVEALKAAHASLCKRVGVSVYSSAEFHSAMDTLCMLGLVELKGGVGLGPRQRVVLQIGEDDVLLALANVPVLKNVVGA